MQTNNTAPSSSPTVNTGEDSVSTPYLKPEGGKSRLRHSAKKKTNRSRSPYKCNKCGKPKKGHICTAASKPSDKLVEAKAPTPVVASSQTGEMYMDTTTSTAASSYFKTTPMSEEFLAYSSTQFPSMNALLDAYQSESNPVDVTSVAFEPHHPIDGLGINLDKQKVPFFNAWFDMAISSLSMLETFLTTQKPVWPTLDEVLKHLDEEKKKLANWRDQFGKEVIDKCVGPDMNETETQEEDTEISEDSNGNGGEQRETKRRKLSFPPNDSGSQSSESNS